MTFFFVVVVSSHWTELEIEIQTSQPVKLNEDQTEKVSATTDNTTLACLVLQGRRH